MEPDTADKLNSLNVSLQEVESTIFHLQTKIFAFKGKLELWKTKIKTVLSIPFQLLTDTNNDTESEQLSFVKPIKNVLTSLRTSLNKYFPEENAPLHGLSSDLVPSFK
nr:SCAN domain-containing protein 3-like [Pelodiscus sinensis]|eukprot:XP_025039699.1 SCAN domain-containing protein 3-like [Pelodiscus sinensis]